MLILGSFVVDGVDLATSLVSTVVAQPTSLACSTISTSAGAGVVAGDSFTVTFTPFDMFYNPIVDDQDVRMVIDSSDGDSVRETGFEVTCGVRVATYTLEHATSMEIQYITSTSIDGEEIDRTVAIDVTAAGVCGRSSRIQGSGTHEETGHQFFTVAGQADTFVILTHDQFENPLTIGGATICISSHSDEYHELTHTDTDNGDGSYTLQLSSSSAGAFRVSTGIFATAVECASQTLDDVTVLVHVLPGAMVLGNTNFLGAGFYGGTQLVEAGFIAVAMDSHGNVATGFPAGSTAVAVSADIAGSADATLSTAMVTRLTEDSCGEYCDYYTLFSGLAFLGDPIIYSIAYTVPAAASSDATVAGTLRVYLDDVQSSSPVEYYPAGHALPAFAASCKVAVGGVFVTESQSVLATAGAAATFTVTLFSESGIQLSLEAGSDALAAAQSSLAATVTAGGVATTSSIVFTYAGSGTFNGDFTLGAIPASELRLMPTFDIDPVGHTAGYLIAAGPGASSAVTSGVSSAGMPQGDVAGTTAVFSMQSVDAFGNTQVTGSPDVYVVSVTQPDATVVQ